MLVKEALNGDEQMLVEMWAKGRLVNSVVNGV